MAWRNGWSNGSAAFPGLHGVVRLSRHHCSDLPVITGKKDHMPSRFAAVRQLPNTVKNTTALALAALFTALLALFVALGGTRHAS